MLVLSRKVNESIVINNEITLTVVSIQGDKIRLGIVAPKDVAVHRQEVFDAIHGVPGAGFVASVGQLQLLKPDAAIIVDSTGKPTEK
jgi:carbon storage regulator